MRHEQRATRRYMAYVFDLDGTIYIGDRVVPGAARTLEWIRGIGAGVTFVTNNPLHDNRSYAAKLDAFGIEAHANEVVTSLDALVGYLHGRPPDGPVLTIAEALVAETLTEAGIEVTDDPAGAAMVVVSWDRTFDYAKLVSAFRAIREGARIVATNPDPFCPTADGGLPDCAAMLAAVEACTGRRAEAIVGKPSTHMAKAILDRLRVPPSDIVVVGDRVLTDMEMARIVGADAALVMTGATTRNDVLASATPPDLVLSDITYLVPAGTHADLQEATT